MFQIPFIIMDRLDEPTVFKILYDLIILLKINDGPMLSIITFMYFVYNVFRKPILRSSLNFSDIFEVLLPSKQQKENGRKYYYQDFFVI